jgi:MYM-type Zinc finger with FCS sequence motif
MRGGQGNRKKIASDDDVPVEKWLVAYRNPASKKHPGGSVFIRQFYAVGYYEAYDTVLTYAENMNMEVMWFREKRSCESLLNRDFPELESLCTYCNKKFNDLESVPCRHEGCKAEFCSRECMADHISMRHKFKNKSTWI